MLIYSIPLTVTVHQCIGVGPPYFENGILSTEVNAFIVHEFSLKGSHCMETMETSLDLPLHEYLMSCQVVIVSFMGAGSIPSIGLNQQIDYNKR